MIILDFKQALVAYQSAVSGPTFWLILTILLVTVVVLVSLLLRARQQARAAQQQAEREKARLMAQARQVALVEETEKLQSALLSSISHDLRTPLATITGALSSLLEDSSILSPADREELIQTAWEGAILLNRLVGNLLDMTRLESGAMKVVCQPNQVEELVGAALSQMPRRLKDRQVSITIPADLPVVDIDLALMVHALVNIIDNALRYSPPEEPVEIFAYPQGDQVVIAVQDRGFGLVESDIDFLFDKFFRGRRGSTQGVGLGLSIAKGIVDAHNGRIWAENRPGGGAIFALALPVSAPAWGEDPR